MARKTLGDGFVETPDPFVTSEPVLLAKQYDQATATLAYLGEAQPGTATNVAQWRIQRLDFTAGVVITWANGDTQFDNIWDNRAGLTYL